MAAWEFLAHELIRETQDLLLDLTDDNSVLIIELNIQRYSKLHYLHLVPTLEFLQPGDRAANTIPGYDKQVVSITTGANADTIDSHPPILRKTRF